MLRIAAVTLLAARLAAVSADDYEYVTEGSIKCDADGSGTATSADLLFNYENMDVEACNDACQCSSGCFFFSVNPASNKCRGYAACDSYAASDGAATHQIYRKVGCTDDDSSTTSEYSLVATASWLTADHFNLFTGYEGDDIVEACVAAAHANDECGECVALHEAWGGYGQCDCARVGAGCSVRDGANYDSVYSIEGTDDDSSTTVSILNPYTTFGNPPPDGIPCSSTADCPTSGDCAANPVCWTHESPNGQHWCGEQVTPGTFGTAADACSTGVTGDGTGAAIGFIQCWEGYLQRYCSPSNLDGGLYASDYCDESTWSDVDGGTVCGECYVLATNMGTYATCHNYCSAQGRGCIDAWEEIGDTCTQEFNAGCYYDFAEHGTSDALCLCGDTEYDAGCSQAYCTSPDGNGGYDCWAGSEHEECSCSNGYEAKETGTTLDYDGDTYYDYVCCPAGTQGTVGEECGECCIDVGAIIGAIIGGIVGGICFCVCVGVGICFVTKTCCFAQMGNAPVAAVQVQPQQQPAVQGAILQPQGQVMQAQVMQPQVMQPQVMQPQVMQPQVLQPKAM